MQKLKKVQQQLQKKNFSGLVLQDQTSIFYLTGMRPSFAKMAVSSKGAFFFVDRRYFEAYRKKSPCPIFLLQKDSFELFLKEHFKNRSRIAFDSSAMTYKHFEDLKKGVKKIGASFKFYPWDRPLKEIRAVKTAEEIRKLKKSAQINRAGLQHIKKLLQEGVTEKEIALQFEIFIRKKGAETLSFEPIVAFGENSSCPHHRSSSRKLKKNEPVLIDIGVVFDGYCSDMTRTLFFGRAPPQLQKLQQVVKKAQKKALASLKAGISVESLEKTVFSLVQKAGYADACLHALGHGVGLQVHEFPVLSRKGEDRKTVLKENMTVAIEPGLYIPGLGGVRMEDTVLITKKGYETFY